MLHPAVPTENKMQVEYCLKLCTVWVLLQNWDRISDVGLSSVVLRCVTNYKLHNKCGSMNYKIWTRRFQDGRQHTQRAIRWVYYYIKLFTWLRCPTHTKVAQYGCSEHQGPGNVIKEDLVTVCRFIAKKKDGLEVKCIVCFLTVCIGTVSFTRPRRMTSDVHFWTIALKCNLPWGRPAHKSASRMSKARGQFQRAA